MPKHLCSYEQTSMKHFLVIFFFICIIAIIWLNVDFRQITYQGRNILYFSLIMGYSGSCHLCKGYLLSLWLSWHPGIYSFSYHRPGLHTTLVSWAYGLGAMFEEKSGPKFWIKTFISRKLLDIQQKQEWI